MVCIWRRASRRSRSAPTPARAASTRPRALPMCSRSDFATRRSPKVSAGCGAMKLARRSRWQSTASKPWRDSSVQSGVVVVVDVVTGVVVVDVEGCTVLVVGAAVVVVGGRVVLVVDVVVVLVVGGSVVEVDVVEVVVLLVGCTVVVVVTASVEDVVVVVLMVVVVVACPGQSGGTGG